MEGTTGILAPSAVSHKERKVGHKKAQKDKSVFLSLEREIKNYDLLIVGAGPAGSFAAELLAKGGAKVALFDGRPEGEPKACGGGVTAKALKAWPQLLNAVGRTISELDLYSPSSKRLHLVLDEPFAIYSRPERWTFASSTSRTAAA